MYLVIRTADFENGQSYTGARVVKDPSKVAECLKDEEGCYVAYKMDKLERVKQIIITAEEVLDCPELR